jgi:hypothetical protein
MSRRYGLLVEQWQAAKAEMRAILIQLARARQTITYGELAAEMRAASIHPYSYAMTNMLDELGRDNEAEGKPTLATLVVRKADGRPGPGFFRKQVAQGATAPDLEAFWQAQFERVCVEWDDQLGTMTRLPAPGRAVSPTE